jgi:hypothetical protein
MDSISTHEIKQTNEGYIIYLELLLRSNKEVIIKRHKMEFNI